MLIISNKGTVMKNLQSHHYEDHQAHQQLHNEGEQISKSSPMAVIEKISSSSMMEKIFSNSSSNMEKNTTSSDDGHQQ